MSNRLFRKTLSAPGLIRVARNCFANIKDTSVDGTAYFSSSSVHCENCRGKHHRDGRTTYYHQLLGAVLVHPRHREVFPLAPEPIVKADGARKNDRGRNAAKRGDHAHLFQWVETSRATQAFEAVDAHGVRRRFRYPSTPVERAPRPGVRRAGSSGKIVASGSSSAKPEGETSPIDSPNRPRPCPIHRARAQATLAGGPVNTTCCLHSQRVWCKLVTCLMVSPSCDAWRLRRRSYHEISVTVKLCVPPQQSSGISIFC